MGSERIFANINEFVQLDKDEKQFLESILISRPFKQGEVIVKGGDTARYLMFVNEGYIMSYHTDKDGNDHVIQFARSGWWSGDVYGLSNVQTTIYTTKGLTEGELLLLPRLALEQLLEKHHKFERYFRITFQNSFIRQQLRIIENHSAEAHERYHAFTHKFPGIEQYIPQKYIASYLGITPEFLSKLRKKQVRVKS